MWSRDMGSKRSEVTVAELESGFGSVECVYI